MTSIGDGAFSYCNITGIITFGDSLLSIGNEAFSRVQFDAIICKSETPPAITSSSFGYEPSLVLYHNLPFLHIRAQLSGVNTYPFRKTSGC